MKITNTQNEKQIKDLPYSIKSDGTVMSYNTYNNSSGIPRVMKSFKTKNGYWYIDLGTRLRTGVHQLVAEYFIDKPESDEVLEVHHKDNNPSNNDASNLEWVTRRENLQHSYKTMSPVRNFKRADLYYKGELVYKGSSVVDAARKANELYGVGVTSMQKYKKSGDCVIEVEGVTTSRET